MTQWGGIESRGGEAVRSGFWQVLQPDERRIATPPTPSREGLSSLLCGRPTDSSLRPPLWPPPSPSRGQRGRTSWRYSNHEWGPRVSLSLPLAPWWFRSMPPWIPRVPVFSTWNTFGHARRFDFEEEYLKSIEMRNDLLYWYILKSIYSESIIEMW